jgi:site-specific DNA recombinase
MRRRLTVRPARGDEERTVRLVDEHLTKRLTELDVKEDNLLDLVEAGGAVAAKVRTRLMAIVEERTRVKSELANQRPLLEAGAAVIRAALDLLDDPQELYRHHRSGTTSAQPSLHRQAIYRRG